MRPFAFAQLLGDGVDGRGGVAEVHEQFRRRADDLLARRVLGLRARASACRRHRPIPCSTARSRRRPALRPPCARPGRAPHVGFPTTLRKSRGCAGRGRDARRRLACNSPSRPDLHRAVGGAMSGLRGAELRHRAEISDVFARVVGARGFVEHHPGRRISVAMSASLKAIA